MCILPAGKCSCFVGYAGSNCGDCSVGFVRSPASTTASSWCIPATSARVVSLEVVPSTLSHQPLQAEVAETPFNPTADSSATDDMVSDAQQSRSDNCFRSTGESLVSESLTSYWIKQQVAEANERQVAHRTRILVIAGSVSAVTPLLAAAVIGRWC